MKYFRQKTEAKGEDDTVFEPVEISKEAFYEALWFDGNPLEGLKPGIWFYTENAKYWMESD